MKHLVVSGFYGAGNAGDEAILDALIISIRKLAPDTAITVLSFDPAGTARQYGVEAVPRYNLRAVIAALRQADLLISGVADCCRMPPARPVFRIIWGWRLCRVLSAHR
jgi:polysaccharide pyruvyl transferase WcaK-like protein